MAANAMPVARESGAAADWLLLVVPGVIWGASFLFIAEGLRAMPPMGVTFGRILIGFLTLALVPAARRPVPRAAWGRIAMLGILWMAFPLSMFPFAEQHVSSAITGMLNGATPLCAAFVASMLARKAPSRGVARGLMIGLGGAVLMALPTLGEGRSSAGGIAMICAALVSYGFAINLARPLQQEFGAIPVVWRAQAVAVILTAPLGMTELAQAHWTMGPLLSMLALGALGTGVAIVLTTIASGRLGATKASATAFLIPGVALILGVVVRGEHVAAVSVLGAAICVAGAWIIRQEQKPAPVRVP